jgi:porin
MHLTTRALSIAAVLLAVLSVAYGQSLSPSPATSTTPQAEKVTSDQQASANTTTPPATPAPEPDFWTQPELTGGWGGARSRWKEKGIELELKLSNFFQGVASGGLEEGSEYNGKFEFKHSTKRAQRNGWSST